MRITAIFSATLMILVPAMVIAGEKFETLKKADAVTLTDRQLDTVRGGTANLIISVVADGGGSQRADVYKSTLGAEVEVDLLILVTPTIATVPEKSMNIFPPDPVR